MGRTAGWCTKHPDCLRYADHEGDCHLRVDPTLKDWDRINKLSAEISELMGRWHTRKSVDAGPYDVVGQARWRLQDAISYWNKEVRKPNE